MAFIRQNHSNPLTIPYHSIVLSFIAFSSIFSFRPDPMLPYFQIILFITMGSSESQQQSLAFQTNYLKQLRSGDPYFGTHYLLLNRNQKDMIISKQLIFRSASQYRQFIAEFQKIERKPFNIIYPKLLVKNGGIETCSNIYEVNAYFQIVGMSLTQVIRKEGCLSESKAWFLLNQVSKSLEIMAEAYRPHWAICPENIYQNSYQNYFIYDSLFVIGFDPQNFLMKKLESNELMSEKMKGQLKKGAIITPTDGFEEDCYGLGFVILFALTGVHPSQLPSDSHHCAQVVKDILTGKRAVISKEMIETILLLTEREALRRMDNYQLRRFLKDKEVDIIRNEEYEYEKSRRREVLTPREQQRMYPTRPSQPLAYSHQFHRGNANMQLQFSPYPIVSPPFSQTRPAYHHQTSIQPLQSPHHKYPQAILHPTQIPDFHSDRSTNLTRINSNDRLNTKK